MSVAFYIENSYKVSELITKKYSTSFSLATSVLEKGPRTFVVAVHTSSDETRDYSIIDKIISRVSEIYREMENVSGADGCRVSQVRCRGRSGNLVDEAWKTINRTVTYGVLYQE